MAIKTTIDYKGNTYAAEIATIESADLGFEDHGILGWNLAFKGASWGQGSGWRALGFENAYGAHVINEVLKAVGANRWSDLKGKRVFVLRDENKYGSIVGLSDMEGLRIILWDEISGKVGL